jgi:transcription initiation factor TFIIIB Brf1 subunit/transcription initiation factor TFIIB
MFAKKVAPDELNQPPGLICPQCGFRIQVTIESLLNNASICCADCGLVLSVDRGKSEAALTALQKVYQSIKKIQNLKAETKNRLFQ